jgi:hypothetical protein
VASRCLKQDILTWGNEAWEAHGSYEHRGFFGKLHEKILRYVLHMLDR